jgi:hypothetical protein
MARLYPRLRLLYELCLFLSKMHLEELAVGLLRVCCRKWRADYLCNLEVAIPTYCRIVFLGMKILESK